MTEESGIKKHVVSLGEFKNRIRLRWRYQKIRFTLYVGSVNAEVLKQAKWLAQVITIDIESHRFDLTLERYRPKKKEKPVIDDHPEEQSVLGFYDLWIRSSNLSPVPYNVQTTRQMVKRWGLKKLTQVPEVFLKEKLHATTFNTRLNILRRFFRWMLKKQHIPLNYFDDIENKKNFAPKRKQRRPYDDDDIRRVLKSYQTDEFSLSREYTHSHYYPFIYFIFSTGVRNGEATGLQVRKINFSKKFIVIDQSLSRLPLKGSNVKNRVLKSTKTGTARNLPLTPELLRILYPLCVNKKPDDFVFTTKNGNPIDDQMFQRRIHKPILKGLGIEDRDLYACRHTFGTVALEQNFSVVDAAYLMGHSNPKTILINYAHLRKIPNRLPKINLDSNSEDTDCSL
jgi:integrase